MVDARIPRQAVAEAAVDTPTPLQVVAEAAVDIPTPLQVVAAEARMGPPAAADIAGNPAAVIRLDVQTKPAAAHSAPRRVSR